MLFLSIETLTLIRKQAVKTTNNKKKKKKRNETKQNKTYHEMTPFIVLICNKERVHEIIVKSKLYIM